MSDEMRTRKARIDLSLRADLARRAEALKLDVSQVLERALEQAIREREEADWLEQNRDAIDSYNERVAQRGVFSDQWDRS